MKIGFVGAGKVGKALGLYFKRHGLELSGYCSRTKKSAQEAAALTGTRMFGELGDLVCCSDVVFITVPDQEITQVDQKAAGILKNDSTREDTLWIHASGAHSSACLSNLKKLGCGVGSMHPLQSFNEPLSSSERLEAICFTIEGTEKAVAALKRILHATGGKYSSIDAQDKPLYHAGACVISNFMVTLLESGIRFFESAGMEREHIVQAISPLIDATLSNVKERGTIDALTGPIVRGDCNTIDVHMQAIEKGLPCELDFYRSMALKTATMLENRRLTDEQVQEFKHILEEKKNV